MAPGTSVRSNQSGFTSVSNRMEENYDMSIVMLLILESARRRVKVYVNNDPRPIWSHVDEAVALTESPVQ